MKDEEGHLVSDIMKKRVISIDEVKNHKRRCKHDE